MEDRSNVPQNWYTFGQIIKGGAGWEIKDLLIRWNERQETRQADGGLVTEYVYDAHRIDYTLPVEIHPGREAVEYYLEQAKSAIIPLAQDLLAQEVGFHDSD